MFSNNGGSSGTNGGINAQGQYEMEKSHLNHNDLLDPSPLTIK